MLVNEGSWLFVGMLNVVRQFIGLCHQVNSLVSLLQPE